MEIPGLSLPSHLSDLHRRLLLDLATANVAARDEDLLGLVLSGSAGRGVATARSDIDVYVVLAENPGGRVTERSALVDEIPVTLATLERVPEFNGPEWGFRWSFAWAPIVLDRSAGRLATALLGQATVTPDEAERILLDANVSAAG